MSWHPFLPILVRLLKDSPSFQAAMKAGKRTTISVRVKRANASRWDDYGVLHTSRMDSWARTLQALPVETIKIAYRIAGKEYPG